MDQLTFVPTIGQFFLWQPAAVAAPEPLPAPVLRLRAAGWPATVQIHQGEAPAQVVQGTLIELLDALPLLVAPADPAEAPPPGIQAWSAAARLVLSLVRAGHLVPRLRARRAHGGDERAAGWEARWSICVPPDQRAALARVAESLAPGGSAEVALPLGRWAPLGSGGPARGYSAAGLLRRFLDVTADTLVREATRRGAYVRLGGWPADAWEQRLVRALVDDRAGFAPVGLDPAVLAREVKAWGDDQALSPSLLPSPPSWQATESLQQVMERMIAPARFLADRLHQGEPAPRTLAPAVLTQRGRLSQAIAVTRTVIQMTQGQPRRKVNG